MFKQNTNVAILLASLITIGCGERHNTEEIRNLLESKKGDPTEMITGAFLAGESGNKEFIPLLLTNVNDVRMCSDIRFKGFDVYQEKMIAVKKIFKVTPPKKITREPDSLIIRFYLNYAKVHTPPHRGE